jgi:hypothetical protein
MAAPGPSSARSDDLAIYRGCRDHDSSVPLQIPRCVSSCGQLYRAGDRPQVQWLQPAATALTLVVFRSLAKSIAAHA